MSNISYDEIIWKIQNVSIASENSNKDFFNILSEELSYYSECLDENAYCYCYYKWEKEFVEKLVPNSSKRTEELETTFKDIFREELIKYSNIKIDWVSIFNYKKDYY